MKYMKRILSLFLALLMLAGCMGVSAFANEPCDKHVPAEPAVENEIAASCTEAGSYDVVVYCSVCGEELSRETVTVEALGHDWDEGTVTLAPTTETEGVMTYNCLNCDEVMTAVLDKLPPEEPEEQKEEGCSDHEHSYTALVTDPTCTENGYTTYTCSICEDTYTDSLTDPLGHEPEAVDALPPTESETGHTAGFVCARCGEILEGCEELPVLQKTVITIEQQPEDAAIVNGRAEFTVVAAVNKDVELSYQWQRLDTSLEYADDAAREAAWEDMDSENNTSLHLAALDNEENLAASSKFVFRCLLTAGDAAMTTEEAGILVPEKNEPAAAEEEENLKTAAAEEEENLKTAAEEEEENLKTTADSGTCGENLEWSFDGTGTLTITGTGEMADFSSENPCPWSGCRSEITTVVLGDGVTSIGDEAFRECTSLTGIHFPDNLTRIGYHAFYYCTNMEPDNDLPSGLTNIGNYAFTDCSSLKQVTIPGGVTVIPLGTFSRCSSLTQVTISEGVTEIESLAFNGCSSLESVTIPSTVVSIYGEAFQGCGNLTAVYIADVGAWCGIAFEDGKVNPLQYASDIYLNNTLLTDLQIPEGVTSIGQYAFKGFSGLRSVSISASVTDIGSGAFLDCGNLETVSFEGVSNTTGIGSSAFKNCTKLREATIPKSVTSIKARAFYNCGNLETLSFEDESMLTDIGEEAFQGCTNLTGDLEIPVGVTSIGTGAFAMCGKLTRASIPDSVTGIGPEAFYSCASLEELVISKNITNIAKQTFYACEHLASVTIPAGVTMIGEDAFGYCTELKTIEFLGKPSFIHENAFQQVYATAYYPADAGWTREEQRSYGGILHWLSKTPSESNGTMDGTNITWSLKNNVLTISGSGEIPDMNSPDSFPWYADHSTIRTLVIESGITRIGDHAFDAITSLESVTIPEGVTGIGVQAFSLCISLKNVTLPSSVINIGPNAFNSCRGLTSIGLGRVQNIDHHAFYDCDSLESLTIPDSMTTIGQGAFSSCEKLKTIFFEGKAPSIDEIAFQGVTATVYYPALPSPDTWTSEKLQDYGGHLTWREVRYNGSFNNAWGTCGSTKWIVYGDELIITGNGAMADYRTSASDVPWYHLRESIKTVRIEAGVTRIGMNAFAGLKITGVTIADTVTEIGNLAFAGCTGLTDVVIPESVTNIDQNAFAGCTGLHEMTFLGAPPTFGYFVFDQVTATAVFPLDKGWRATDMQGCSGDLSWVSSAGDQCGDNLRWKVKDGSLIIYGTGDMYNYDNRYSGTGTPLGDKTPWYSFDWTISGVRLEPGVTRIGSFAFSHTDLTSVEIPDGVTGIGSMAFRNCRSLKSVTIPESVTDIGDGAFSWCGSLESVTVPAGVTSIGSTAFGQCGMLKKITFRGDSPAISDDAFYNVEADACYSPVRGWTEQDMQDYGGDLTWKPIPLNRCGDNLFWFIENDTLVITGTGDMYDMSHNSESPDVRRWIDVVPLISEVDIEPGAASIGNLAFQSTDLTKVTIPASVTRIGDGAFSSCRKLDTVLFEGPPPTISGNAFSGVKASAKCQADKGWTAQHMQNYGGTLTWVVSGYYTVSYDANGGSGAPAAQTKTHGTALTLSAGRPTRSGYTFLGWSESASASSAQYQPGGSFTKDASVTLYAIWKANTPPKPADPVEEFVRRCYRLILGREGEAKGVSDWKNALKTGTRTGAEIVSGFINSQEFFNQRNSNEQVVTILYRAMLGREPDAGGKASWVSILDGGCSYDCIVDGFSGSQEFGNICASYGIRPGRVNLTQPRDRNPRLTAFVNRNYRYALNRQGEAGGLNDWCDILLQKRQTPQEVAHGFVFSPECLNMNLDNRAFLVMLYHLYMDREPDESGLNGWLAVLNSGGSREEVANGFAESVEFHNIVASYGL